MLEREGEGIGRGMGKGKGEGRGWGGEGGGGEMVYPDIPLNLTEFFLGKRLPQILQDFQVFFMQDFRGFASHTVIFDGASTLIEFASTDEN